MIATEARMFTLDEAGKELGFTHKHRAKTVARLAKKGLRLTKYGYRTKFVNELDLMKFKHERRELEKTTKMKK